MVRTVMTELHLHGAGTAREAKQLVANVRTFTGGYQDATDLLVRGEVDLAIGGWEAMVNWAEEKGRWIRWAPGWPAERVADALRSVLAADRALKGTTISDERGILTDMVLRMATSRRAAA